MGSIYRNTHRDMIDSAVSAQIAAQGDSQTMQKYVKDLENQASVGIKKPGNDINKLRSMLSKKGGI